MRLWSVSKYVSSTMALGLEFVNPIFSKEKKLFEPRESIVVYNEIQIQIIQNDVILVQLNLRSLI